MKKTLVFLWYLIICALLIACSNQSEKTLVNPSSTFIWSATFTPALVKPTFTPTLRPTETFSPTFTTTLEYPLYPTKEVIFEYRVLGSHSPFDINLDSTGSNLVLYSDGQMIIPGTTFQQKILSADEISQFFSQLEAIGLFSLTQDNLYNFGNQEPPKVYDGYVYCVLVTGNREQNICAYEPHESFLVPEMKNILRFLDKYQPKGVTPYYPDRILLWVQVGRNPYLDDVSQLAIAWPENFKSLQTSSEKIMYFQGDEAKKIFALFDNQTSNKVFSEKGREYTVAVAIALPHEQVIPP